VTMAHIFVRQAEFLRSKKKSTIPRCEVRSNITTAAFQADQGVLQIAMSNRSRSHDQSAIGNRFGHCLIHLGGGQRRGRTHGRTSIAKCHIVRIHYPKIRKSKIAHRPGGRTDVERIAHVHEHDAQSGEFGWNRQAVAILTAKIAKKISAERWMKQLILHFFALLAPHLLRPLRPNGLARTPFFPQQAFCRRAFLPVSAIVKNLSNRFPCITIGEKPL
jgi:hypothetical protein